VNEGIANVLKIIRQQEGAERALSFSPGDAGELVCIPQEFHEIVSNLIQNAVDAADDKTRITITAESIDNEVVVRVEDTGPGIPPEIRDKIFSPFFTTKEPGRGMGMGLTIVHRLVKKYGGRIDLQSEVGKGTCFTVTLPAEPPKSTETLEEKEE
jgi:signal transduction histidine kinase